MIAKNTANRHQPNPAERVCTEATAPAVQARGAEHPAEPAARYTLRLQPCTVETVVRALDHLIEHSRRCLTQAAASCPGLDQASGWTRFEAQHQRWLADRHAVLSQLTADGACTQPLHHETQPADAAQVRMAEG